MDKELIKEILQSNPWLTNEKLQTSDNETLIERVQLEELLNPEWDRLWTLLIGPRRAGKTTLGHMLCRQLIQEGRYHELLYLNCDYLNIRKWLESPLFISQALAQFKLKKPILFIDEVQRITNPGLTLKAVIDLGLQVKHIATGSSQLEIRSKVQEHLTGRQLTSTILPLSLEERPEQLSLEDLLLYGNYPQVVLSTKKEREISEIYDQYIRKDIVEILKLGNPDIFRSLLTLVAHTSGQLLNYNQLAVDCKVSVSMVRNHLDILEQTFVIHKLRPFVGNLRSEITKNPVYYFIDNGFRNKALNNFSPLKTRTDIGLLVEGFVFQELLKHREERFLSYNINYWRTKSGAEVDFVLSKPYQWTIPIEVKCQNLSRSTISRGYRSFIEAYQPSIGFVINKNFIGKKEINGCTVHFLPLSDLKRLFELAAPLFA